jgi:polyisoprenoid-binding protein YceI
MKFTVQRGLVEVKARSAIHDTVTRWSRVGGVIRFDADDPGAAHAEIEVDMRSFDAGDRLKNWKLKSDLDPDSHPTAQFVLGRLDQVHEEVAGRFVAGGVGQLQWRGKRVDIAVRGKATVDRMSIEASASFELDVKTLGVSPPRFLMFKVEDVVSVTVTLRALAGG